MSGRVGLRWIAWLVVMELALCATLCYARKDNGTGNASVGKVSSGGERGGMGGSGGGNGFGFGTGIGWGGGVFGSGFGGFGRGGIYRPYVVCSARGPCYKKKLACPEKCFKVAGKGGPNGGGGGGGGGCTIDCKRMCQAYC